MRTKQQRPVHIESRFLIKFPDWETHEALTQMAEPGEELTAGERVEQLTSKLMAASVAITWSREEQLEHRVPWRIIDYMPGSQY